MKLVTFQEYDAHHCPVCGSGNLWTDEHFDRTYLITNQCEECKAWWTAMYVLDSVCVRDTPYPKGDGKLLPGQPPTYYTDKSIKKES